MKKTVIAVLAGLSLVSPVLAKDVIVKTIDNKTYSVPEENAKAFVLRIGHAFMDWEKYLKDE